MGARDGGFNLLNTPDDLYKTPNQFWKEYNQPWLDNVITRNDKIYLATDPVDNNLFKISKLTGEKELTGFGKEYQYLIDQGYHYDVTTKMMIKD
ncbi:hypothetical protein [Paenibacillus sp. FSL K6-2524]|uniref:hypothetical protein n=1 Tax=Paenibacillus sp. FSL K6-2524 TaxID=2954516 RepID=UPI0030FC14D1